MQEFNYNQPMDPAATFVPETPSQTAGPYVHIGMALKVAGLPEREHEIGSTLAQPNAKGRHIEIRGRILDGIGAPIADALTEMWQADSEGKYVTDYRFSNVFNSLGRSAPKNRTPEEGGWWNFHTVKPGQVAFPDGRLMAPHVGLAFFSRGINIHLQTRMYFDDEEAANKACPFLNHVVPERRATLIATHTGKNADGEEVYEFTVRLQGLDETVFFDF